ncbi:MAG: methylated-DNA/protein-cysteinemethyltransferase [Deltaproteobacteria bacterium]|nr:methylated-DNA/protein-cysteinemethyltransferase [Deltaproteobacteria bacterium]
MATRLAQAKSFQRIQATTAINKRSHFAGGVLTPPLFKYRKGDACPLWKPHLTVPRCEQRGQRIIYWGEITTPLGPLFAAVSDRGVCAVEFGRRKPKFSTLSKIPARLAKNARAVAPVMAQLREYFTGQRSHFDLPVDLSSLTPFQLKVLTVTRQIPTGQTWSYQRVAQTMGRPKSSRAVGQALGRNPIPIVIPCHRVIASDGSLGGYSGGSGLKAKRWLLQHEGAPS